MDPLSISAAIAGFLALADSGIVYANDFVKATKDRKALVDRCGHLRDDLKNIQIRIDQAHEVEDAISTGPFGRKTRNDKLFRRYKEAIEPNGRFAILKKNLNDLFDDEFKAQASKRRELGRRFVWTWKKDDLKARLDHVIALANGLRNFLQDDDAQIGHEALAGILRLERTSEEELTIQILNWISPPDQDAVDVLGLSAFHVSPVADPFIASCQTYQQWVTDAETEHWHLNCYGKPGTGKSNRARVVISDLLTRFQPQGIPVLCIRFNHLNASQQSLSSVYRRMLRQTLSQSTTNYIPDSIRRVWNERRLGGYSGLTEFEAKSLLMEELKKYKKKFIILDALDEAGECADSIHSALTVLRKQAGACIFSTTRQNPLASARFIGCNGCGKATNDLYWQCKICVGSLGHRIDLCRDCYLSGKKCNDTTHKMQIPGKVNIEVSPSTQEVEHFVKASLKKELSLDDTGDEDQLLFEGFSPNLKHTQKELGSKWDSVPGQIATIADHSYLIADLIVRRLNAQKTVGGARRILQDLQTGVNSGSDDQYNNMLDICINSGDQEGRQVAYDYLGLMSCTQLVLTFTQLSHAVAIQPNDKTLSDFQGRCCNKQIVRKETHGLLTVGEFGSPQAFNVTFFHQTLKSYLDKHSERWFEDAHQKMFDACCYYLQLDAFKEPFANPKALDKALVEYPFASYAAVFWGEHLRQTPTSNDNIVSVLELLNEPSRKKAITQIARHMFSRAELSWDVPGDVGPLHVCAFQGLADMCQILIDDGEGVNYGEQTHRQTPLHYACRRGHNNVVKILLDESADPNVASDIGKTPLMEAIESNRVDTVELLLSHDSTDVNAHGGAVKKRTALHLAAQNGQAKIVEMLLRHSKILVNQPDSQNITALAWAVKCPSEDCVKLLLQRPDIDLTIKDLRVGTAMDNLALEYPPESLDEVERIAQLFLQHPGVSLLGAGMHYLIEEQQDSLLQMFLSRESYAGWKDEHGRTLLHIAALCGDKDGLKMVQDHLHNANALLIKRADRYGRTPLHAACSRYAHDDGHAAVVLLEAGAEPLVKDSGGRTPVNIALENSEPSEHDAVIATFQRYLPPGSTTFHQVHAFSLESMIKFGSVDQLEAMIQHQSSPPVLEHDPYTGWTPLHLSMRLPRPEMLRVLLPQAVSYIDACDNVGQTCLHKAVDTECEDGVKILTDQGADLNVKDKWGDTAFEIAQHQPGKTCSLLLLTAGATVTKTSIQPDLLHHAVAGGDVQAVKRLIDEGVDIHFRQRGVGPTPIQIAKDMFSDEVSRQEHELWKNQWRAFNDEASLLQAARQSAKAKTYQQIIAYLEDEEGHRQRRPSTFPHRDLASLIRRLRPKDEQQRGRATLSPPQKRIQGLSPPPSYERVVTNSGRSSSPARSFGQVDGLGISNLDSKSSVQASKSISNLGQAERIAFIIVGGVVAIAWMWLILHYLSQPPKVIHEL